VPPWLRACVATVVGSGTIPALRSDEIDSTSKTYPELAELRQCIQTGDWSNCSCKKCLPLRQWRTQKIFMGSFIQWHMVVICI